MSPIVHIAPRKRTDACAPREDTDVQIPSVTQEQGIDVPLILQAHGVVAPPTVLQEAIQY